MSYDYKSRKTVIAVATELGAGVASNVIGHLALAVGHRVPHSDMGQDPLIDATGFKHVWISRYPVGVVAAKSARLRRLLTEAREASELIVVDYPEQMLTTGHDDELVAAIGAAHEGTIRYLGVALHGPASVLLPITGKFSLWGAASRTGPN